MPEENIEFNFKASTKQVKQALEVVEEHVENVNKGLNAVEGSDLSGTRKAINDLKDSLQEARKAVNQTETGFDNLESGGLRRIISNTETLESSLREVSSAANRMQSGIRGIRGSSLQKTKKNADLVKRGIRAAAATTDNFQQRIRSVNNAFLRTSKKVGGIPTDLRRMAQAADKVDMPQMKRDTRQVDEELSEIGAAMKRLQARGRIGMQFGKTGTLGGEALAQTGKLSKTTDLAKRGTVALAKMGETGETALAKVSDKTKTLARTTDRAEAQTKELKNEFMVLNKQGSVMERMQKDFKELAASANQAEERVEDLNKDMARGATTGRKMANTSRKASRGSSKLQQAMGGLNSSIQIFWGLAVYRGFGLITQNVAEALRKLMDFNKAIAEANSLIRGSNQTVERLRKNILDIASEVPTDPSELGAGVYQIFSSGVLDAAKAQDVLRTTAKGAAAGLTDVETATKATMAVINAYGLEASQAQRINDMFFKTIKRGVLRMEDLDKALGTLAPAASLFNIRIEEMLGALQALTKSGISAQRSATFLRQALQVIADPAQESLELARKLGVELSGAALSSKGLVGVVGDLRSALGKLSPETQRTIDLMTKGVISFREAQKELKKIGGRAETVAKLFSSRRGLMAVAPLIKNFQRFKNNVEATKDSADAMEEAYKRATDTIKAELTLAINNLMDSMSGLIEFMKDGATALKQITVVLNEFSETVSGVLGTIGFLAAAAGSLMIFSKVSSAIGGYVSGLIAAASANTVFATDVNAGTTAVIAQNQALSKNQAVAALAGRKHLSFAANVGVAAGAMGSLFSIFQVANEGMSKSTSVLGALSGAIIGVSVSIKLASAGMLNWSSITSGLVGIVSSLRNGLTGLRAAMVSTSVSARTLKVAIGGIVGIIAVMVTQIALAKDEWTKFRESLKGTANDIKKTVFEKISQASEDAADDVIDNLQRVEEALKEFRLGQGEEIAGTIGTVPSAGFDLGQAGRRQIRDVTPEKLEGAATTAFDVGHLALAPFRGLQKLATGTDTRKNFRTRLKRARVAALTDITEATEAGQIADTAEQYAKANTDAKKGTDKFREALLEGRKVAKRGIFVNRLLNQGVATNVEQAKRMAKAMMSNTESIKLVETAQGDLAIKIKENERAFAEATQQTINWAERLDKTLKQLTPKKLFGGKFDKVSTFVDKVVTAADKVGGLSDETKALVDQFRQFQKAIEVFEFVSLIRDLRSVIAPGLTDRGLVGVLTAGLQGAGVNLGGFTEQLAGDTQVQSAKSGGVIDARMGGMTPGGKHDGMVAILHGGEMVIPKDKVEALKKAGAPGFQDGSIPRPLRGIEAPRGFGRSGGGTASAVGGTIFGIQQFGQRLRQRAARAAINRARQRGPRAMGRLRNFAGVGPKQTGTLEQADLTNRVGKLVGKVENLVTVMTSAEEQSEGIPNEVGISQKALEDMATAIGEAANASQESQSSLTQLASTVSQEVTGFESALRATKKHWNRVEDHAAAAGIKLADIRDGLGVIQEIKMQEQMLGMLQSIQKTRSTVDKMESRIKSTDTGGMSDLQRAIFQTAKSIEGSGDEFVNTILDTDNPREMVRAFAEATQVEQNIDQSTNQNIVIRISGDADPDDAAELADKVMAEIRRREKKRGQGVRQ